MIQSSIRSYDVASAKAAIPQFNGLWSRERGDSHTDRFHNPTPRSPLGESEKRLISACPLFSAQGETVSANSRMPDRLQLPVARFVEWSW